MHPCYVHLHFQLSLALFAFIELAVGGDQELSVTIGNVAPLKCLISRQLPHDRPVSWYWTPLYPECSGSNGGKVLDIYPDGRTAFEEEFKGRVLVYRSKIKKGDFSITIRGVMIPDSGEYICAHEDLSEENRVRLTVKPGCWANLHLTVNPPVVSVGDRVTLTCTYCGTKVITPRIKWQYDGLAISDTGVVSIINGGQSLVISQVDQEHLKKYGCSLAKKESIVTETCLNIELDFLDTTIFGGDYDYPETTSIHVSTSESSTMSTVQETTTTRTSTAEAKSASLNIWKDSEWMQDMSPVTSLETESYSTTITETVKTKETSDLWNEDVIPSQQGSTETLCPMTVTSNGGVHFSTSMCIILGGILLLIIIAFLIKRYRRFLKFGTHDVERNTSDPNNDDIPSSEVPETQDPVLMKSENNDDGTKEPADGEMEELHKNEDENKTAIEIKEVGVEDSNHAKTSEDAKSQEEVEE